MLVTKIRKYFLEPFILKLSPYFLFLGRVSLGDGNILDYGKPGSSLSIPVTFRKFHGNLLFGRDVFDLVVWVV